MTPEDKKTRGKFKVFVCYDKEDHKKASTLESILEEKGFGAFMAGGDSHGNFISTELKDMIRSSICFIAILTSNLLNSSLLNQEIGYAQGKGLRVILVVNAKLKDEIQDIKTKLTVIEFNEDDFRQQCVSVANKVAKISEILDEPIDFESFLDFYTKDKTKPA
ncbi:MAG: toll/interleukin-1 receptor domain-containing protein [Nitrosotalea sp.]